MFIKRHTKVGFSIGRRESSVGNLTSCYIIEQSVEGEEVYQFCGGRRQEGEDCWELQLP